MEAGNSEDSARFAGRGTGRRRYQFTLRGMFLLTTAAAAFFSAASALGCADAVVMLLATGVLVCAMRRPRPVRLVTGVLLTLIAAILVWANLRPTGSQQELGLDTPARLDPITERMFWRGWPVCPFMLCLIHGLTFHPDESSFVQAALICDAAVFVASVYASRSACERFLRWARERNRIEKNGERKRGHHESAGQNRHGVAYERAAQERNSEPS